MRAIIMLVRRSAPIALTLTSVALAACASLPTLLGGMSAAQCRTADWQTLGYEDGAQGTDALGISRHRRACAPHGVAPDLEAYERGRLAGIEQYCRPQNGYVMGERGAAYTGVCPRQSEAAFLGEYTAGKRVHEAAALVSSTSSAIYRAEKRIEEIDDKLARRQAALVAGGMSASARAGTVNDTLELARERGQLEGELRRLRTDLVRHEDALADTRARRGR
jgi:hypothetical protein